MEKEALSRRGYVVVPCFNEAENVVALATSIAQVWRTQESPPPLSLVFVDDGSRDKTVETLYRFTEKFEKINENCKLILLPLLRNFGHQSAVVHGLKYVAEKPDALFAITMDSDGEHPPKLLPDLVALWREHRVIVHTERAPSKSLPLFKRITSALFYKLVSWGKVRISPGRADFKLWDGALLRQVSKTLPYCGSTRLFAQWLCPDGPTLKFDQIVVEGRVSRFTLKKMFEMASSSFIAFSEFPLRLGTFLGLFSIFFSLIASVFFLISYFWGFTVPGWTTLALMVAFFGGVQMFSIGIVSEYMIHFLFRRSLPVSVQRDLPLK